MKHHKVCDDNYSGSYSLHLRLPGGKMSKKVWMKEVEDIMLREVKTKGSGKHKEEAAAKAAVKAKVKVAEATAKKNKATPTQGTDAESPTTKKFVADQSQTSKGNTENNVKRLCILNILGAKNVRAGIG
jgi:hypothetical protein